MSTQVAWTMNLYTPCCAKSSPSSIPDHLLQFLVILRTPAVIAQPDPDHENKCCPSTTWPISTQRRLHAPMVAQSPIPLQSVLVTVEKV